MAEIINTEMLTEHLKTALRYLASGFITIIVFKYLGHDVQSWIISGDDSLWYLIIIASIFGLMIYSLHAALFDDYFYWLTLYIIIRYSKKDYYWPEEFDTPGYTINNKKRIKRIMFDLTTYRFRREFKAKLDAKSEIGPLQDQMGKYLAFLVFLYTSSYSIMFIPLFYIIRNNFSQPDTSVEMSERFLYTPIFGITLLLFGLLLDYKTTKRELWIVREYKELLQKKSAVINTDQKNYTVDLNVNLKEKID